MHGFIKNNSTRLLSVGAIVAAIGLQDVGGALAKSLFPRVGADGMILLRLTIAAALLLAIQRPWRRPIERRYWPALLAYGVVLGIISILLYRAFARLPIGIAVGIQAIGPLMVALLTSRTVRDFLWLALAAGGLWLLLPSISGVRLDPGGLAYAGAGAACWAVYILCGKHVAHLPGAQAVSWGMLIAALIVAPFGVAAGGAALLAPAVLGMGLLVALLSSVIPNTLEMLAMPHLPYKVLGIVMSSAPAFAALAGFFVLGERLQPIQWTAIALIMLASAASAATTQRQTP